MNRRRVKYIRLHATDTFIPGVGNIGPELPSQSRSLDVTMHRTQDAVEYEITWKGVKYAGDFPSANLKVVLYEDDAPVIPIRGSGSVA